MKKSFYVINFFKCYLNGNLTFNFHFLFSPLKTHKFTIIPKTYIIKIKVYLIRLLIHQFHSSKHLLKILKNLIINSLTYFCIFSFFYRHRGCNPVKTSLITNIQQLFHQLFISFMYLFPFYIH